MASLSDLQVFNEYVYSSSTEVLRQQIELFNAATRGAIVLRSSAHQGDFSELAFFKKISGLVRRRDAYDSTPTSVNAVDIEHLLDVSVKVAAGTPPVNIPPSQYRWIQQNPAVAGAAMGQQLAVDMFADMLNTSLMAAGAAIGQKSALTVDKSGESTATATFEYLLNASELMGDRAQQVAVWVMHSHVMFDLWSEALANSNRLFVYGNVNVVSDPFGRIFVMTDSSALHYTDTDEHYRTLGLVPGGLYIGQNNDMESNWDTSNGYENIQRTYQAEWSYNLGIKGFAWDKTNGQANPDDSDLATAAYWDSYYSDAKDAAGVQLITL
jgi:hypothetical protein